VPLIAVASLAAGVLLSHDGGTSWTTGGTGLADPAASSVAIVETSAGQPALLAAFADGVYRSLDVEAGWQPVAVPGHGDARPSRLSALGDGTAGSPLVLAAGPRLLALSEDGGDSWRSLPLPAPEADLVGAAASPDVLRDGTLYAVVRATRVERDGSVVDAGRELWQTANLGQSWSRWLTSPTATVMPVAVPRPGDLAGSVLAGHAGRVARPLPRSQEVGRGERRPLWQETRIGNLSSAITAIAISPHAGRDGTVLAAADDGVYLSRDGGAAFSAWDASLDVPLVTGLAIASAEDGSLTAYALGLGGTLWRQPL
jgi:photosystem II stability/assembly factor-like uncharacterized protein